MARLYNNIHKAFEASRAKQLSHLKVTELFNFKVTEVQKIYFSEIDILFPFQEHDFGGQK